MLTRIVLVACFVAIGAVAQEGSVSEPVRGFTPERLMASSSALVGLIGAVVGGVALARARSGRGNRAGLVALAAGAIALVGGGLVVATADGGVGTGNGIAGGFVALLLGFISLSLGGLARARSRRAGGPSGQISGT